MTLLLSSLLIFVAVVAVFAPLLPGFISRIDVLTLYRMRR